MSNDTMIIIFVILFLAGLAAYLLYFRPKMDKAEHKTETLSNLPVKLPPFENFKFTYPNEPGKPFISSVVAVPPEAQAAMIKGLQMLLRSIEFKFPHWNAARKIEDYNIMLIDPQAELEQGYPGAPSLMVSGIESAGTVIGFPEQKISPPNIVLPHQTATDWRYLDYLAEATRFEGEHYAELLEYLKNADQEVWKYVGTTDSHPHHKLPEELGTPSIQGFAGLSNPKPACGFRAMKKPENLS